METNGTKTATFQAKAETLLILAYIVKHQDDGTIEWKDLAAACNCRNLARVKGWCHSARRMAVKSHNLVFDSVKGVGIRKMQDDGLVGVGQAAIDSIRHKANGARRKMECVKDLAALPNEQRNALIAYSCHLGAIANASSGTVTKRITAGVEKAKERLSLEATLEAFKS